MPKIAAIFEIVNTEIIAGSFAWPFFFSDAMIKKEDERNKVNNPAEKKKRKREKGNNFDGGDAIQISRGLKVFDIANCLPI